MLSDPELEPKIKYGSTFLRHLQRIWKLRISYPNRDLYLWDDDITGAFRLIKYNPDIASTFAANIMGTLWILTGQVFGSNTSPQKFESAANARELVAEFFSKNTKILLKK